LRTEIEDGDSLGHGLKGRANRMVRGGPRKKRKAGREIPLRKNPKTQPGEGVSCRRVVFQLKPAYNSKNRDRSTRSDPI
jgi:hypothetical protein